MNVKQIRQRIFDQMDYFPDLQRYKDSVVRRMNDRYQELCDSAHWLWIQKQEDLRLDGDVTGESGKTITISASNLRQVTASGFSFTLQMEGQILEDTSNGTQYTIIRVESATRLYIHMNFNGSASTAISDFKIKINRFPLPNDCIEVLSYTDRKKDRGKLLFISNPMQERVYLDFDNTGDPSCIIENEFVLDDPPLGYDINLQNKKFTARTVLLGGSFFAPLRNGVTYAYKYTIYREGRESPPSDEVTVTIPDDTNIYSVVLSGMDDTGFYDGTSSKTSKSGMIKLLYRRDTTIDGKWELIGSIKSNETVFKDVTLVNTDGFDAGYPNQELSDFRYTSSTDVKRFQEVGPKQYIKVWYRPTEKAKLEIRYHFRPKNLEADNDVPVIPVQYHVILVYLTLHEMFLQMQDMAQAQIFEGRAELLKQQMRRRYLARDDEPKRFSRFDRPRRFRNLFGPPTSDFSGAN
ncbi:MAG: hypothetical protein CMC15_17860 [Flavobacteriaceae bacterium]|nr:hypothetical protein [Flavobacteriaceae bacterium]